MDRKQLPPSRHLVDAGYVDAELLVQSAQIYGIELFGPTRLNSSWQAREGGIDATQFQINWDHQQVGGETPSAISSVSHLNPI